MVAVTESSEGAAVEEKYGTCFTSTNGLHKPDSEVVLYDDQAKDPYFSDIPETEYDDISNSILNEKDAIQEGSTIVPEDTTTVVDQGTGLVVPNGHLEDVSREFGELLSEDNVSNLKGTDGELLLLNGATSEQRNFAEVGDLVQDLDSNILENNDGDTLYCSEVPNTEPATSNLKLENGAPNSSPASCVETTSHHLAVTCTKLVSDLANVSNEGAENISFELTELNLDRHVESASDNDENLLEYDTGKILCNSISMDSADDSSATEVWLDKAITEVLAKPFNFLARVPRFNDESLRDQITVCKLNIEEKTKVREAIQVQIQEKRADNQIRSRDYKNAKIEHRKAWDLVTLKRMEIDSVLSLINKAKNASSIQDIDSQIYNMERMIQHETHTLKEEKQLLLEIKRLKQLRGELSSNLGSQDEIKQALEQREELEDRLKVLRKELDVLKRDVQKAETAVVKAAKKYEDGYKKVKELQIQFRKANEVRQAAYADLQSLRKELQEKNKHFFKYKDDAAAAGTHASKGDKETLHHLCMNQVETFMKLWSDNEEFRKEYVKYNTRSTIKRLGTLDGRSLGPEEEPPFLPNFSGGTVEAMAHKEAHELKRETTVENLEKSDVILPVETLTVNKNHKKLADRAPTKPVDEFTVISEDDSTHDDVPEKSVEEIELERREEEAKLKAQRRLEELVKANEARERKKRQAEKELLRAQLKALKESELREKEREKKLRKKQKAAAEANDTHKKNEVDANTSAENVVETGLIKEAKDTSDVANKKANSKPLTFSKQSKSKPVPPPLRNRNKKYYRQWLLVGASCIGIIVLFWLGNLGAFYKANLKRQSPASLTFR